MQRNDPGPGRRAGERDQAPLTQDQAAAMAIAAVMRVVEAESALHPQPAIGAPVQAQARSVHALVEPLHAGGIARIAAKAFGLFGRRARRVPEREGGSAGNHQQDQTGHPRTLAEGIAARTLTRVAAAKVRSTAAARRARPPEPERRPR